MVITQLLSKFDGDLISSDFLIGGVGVMDEGFNA